jgi:hypothetical protein
MESVGINSGAFYCFDGMHLIFLKIFIFFLTHLLFRAGIGAAMKNININISHKICAGIVSFLAISGTSFGSAQSSSPLPTKKRSIHDPRKPWHISEYRILVQAILNNLDESYQDIAFRAAEKLSNRSYKAILVLVQRLAYFLQENPGLRARLSGQDSSREDFKELREQLKKTNNQRNAEGRKRANERIPDISKSREEWSKNNVILLAQTAYEHKKQAADNLGNFVDWNEIPDEIIKQFKRTPMAINGYFHCVNAVLLKLLGKDFLAYLSERLEEPAYRGPGKRKAIKQILTNPDPKFPGAKNTPVVEAIQKEMPKLKKERRKKA